ncbi:MAG TPA: hypothetical protein VLJ14_07655 [Ktedonobacterales bacterium]|nr:hypothetical protein [Ktedonobacterales bacterium]
MALTRHLEITRVYPAWPTNQAHLAPGDAALPPLADHDPSP